MNKYAPKNNIGNDDTLLCTLVAHLKVPQNTLNKDLNTQNNQNTAKTQ